MLDMNVIEPYLEPAYTVEERCMRSAAHDFRLDYFVIKAIREAENGKSGQYSNNSNDTRDHGEMQVNDIVISDFAEYGITGEDLLRDTCLNIYTGVAHLWRKIAETGQLWKGVAWYHSKTERLGTPYARRVYRRYSRMVSEFSDRVSRMSAERSVPSNKTASR